jgi:hypothetical protein
MDDGRLDGDIVLSLGNGWLCMSGYENGSEKDESTGFLVTTMILTKAEGWASSYENESDKGGRMGLFL